VVVHSTVQFFWLKRIDNSRLVRQRDPNCVREGATLLGGALICLGVILLCAWQHFQFVHTGYRLEELRARQDQVQEWNRTLRLEQAALLDPMRVDAVARNQLGLDAPLAGQVVPLGSGEVPAVAPLLARDRGPDSSRPTRRLSYSD
jgi:cell division protein FtsL